MSSTTTGIDPMALLAGMAQQTEKKKGKSAEKPAVNDASLDGSIGQWVEADKEVKKWESSVPQGIATAGSGCRWEAALEVAERRRAAERQAIAGMDRLRCRQAGRDPVPAAERGRWQADSAAYLPRKD